MTAKLIMDPNPIRIHSADTIGIAARKIMRRRYRSLPVVDDQRKFIGVVKVYRLLRLILPDGVTHQSIGEAAKTHADFSLDNLRENLEAIANSPVTLCVEQEVVTVTPETSLIETLLTMYHHRRNLPVVDSGSGRLEGMISYYDIGDKLLMGGFSQGG